MDEGVSPEQVTIAFGSDDLGRLMPFHILTDAGGVVRAVGPAIHKLLGAEAVIGKSVFDIVDFLKPKLVDRKAGLQSCIGRRLVVQFRELGESVSSRVFGMALRAGGSDDGNIFMALTPGVNARAFVESFGLKISDFGPADGSADLLPLLAMQQDMLADSRKKSDNLAAARDAAERMANNDALTDLPNRRALMCGLQRALGDGPINVLHIDLDKFKDINDTFGHAAGDAALRHTARCMQNVLGSNTLCARIGGDEFVAVIPDRFDEAKLIETAQCLIEQICLPFTFEGEALNVGASIGIAIADATDAVTVDTILHHADIALYESKRLGRGRALICSPHLLKAQTEFQELSADIRRGLSEQEFTAYLQPQVEAKSGCIVGVEALVRWEHPVRGLLEPASFLDETRRAGLVQNMDMAIRMSALETLETSRNHGVPIPKLSLNVTTLDLIDPQFYKWMLWDIDARDLAPSQVVIEIVETVFFDQNATQITQACQALVDHGFLLALDDFGTGHASALSLLNLPLSIVKIDRAFADGAANDARKKAMVRSLVGMASTCGLDIIAEGVGGVDDVAFFQDLGCDNFQSFHFSPPMSRDDLIDLMVSSGGFIQTDTKRTA